MVAVLVSIERLPSDFIAQAEDYMDRVLVEGSRVLSIPEGYVYEVGTRNDLRGPGRYLHYLDAKNQRSGGRTVVTAAELLAFEPTERKRPLGRPDIKPCKPAPPSYDTICNVETYGNTSLIRNRVIVIGSQADFERFAEGVRIVAGADRDPRGALADDFPWGVVTETGRLAVVSPRSGLGNPLVALTRDPLLLRELCTTKGTEKGSRIVLTDNVDLTMRSLDLVERIGEAQRFMLLAPARRREDVAVLRSRGWLVWEPQPWELRAMDSAPGGRRHRPPDRATSLLAREAFATLGITASMGALQLQRSERRCGETRSTSCSLRTKYEATLKKRREELLRQMRGKRKTRAATRPERARRARGLGVGMVHRQTGVGGRARSQRMA